MASLYLQCYALLAHVNGLWLGFSTQGPVSPEFMLKISFFLYKRPTSFLYFIAYSSTLLQNTLQRFELSQVINTRERYLNKYPNKATREELDIFTKEKTSPELVTSELLEHLVIWYDLVHLEVEHNTDHSQWITIKQWSEAKHTNIYPCMRLTKSGMAAIPYSLTGRGDHNIWQCEVFGDTLPFDCIF